MTESEPKKADENPLKEFVQNLSGLGAAIEALKHAGIYGTGIIRRKEDGFFEAVNPSTHIITITDSPIEQALDILKIDRWILYFDQTITAKAWNTETLVMPSMQEQGSADVVVAVMKDGTKRLVKNRLGGLDDERWLR